MNVLLLKQVGSFSKILDGTSQKKLEVFDFQTSY